jgi:hypothetical protein
MVVLTLVIGAVALVYYFTSDLNRKLGSRTAASNTLILLSTGREGKEKDNAESVKKNKEWVELVRAAVKKDAADSSNLNRRNFQVLQVSVRGQMQDAFPVNERLYIDEGLFYVFIQQYTKVLDSMVNAPAVGRTTRPTDQEVNQEELNLKEKYKDQARVMAVKSMKIKKAERGMVFIDEDALDRYFTTETKAPSEKLWESQVNLWVTQEILQAIVTTNDEVAAERKAAGIGPAEANVFSSPVKRLAKIIINEGFAGAAAAAPGAFGGAGKGGSLTGRTSTSDYGLVTYQFTVVMATHHVPRLLRNLMQQNYHTVVNVVMSEVPYGERNPYYYGTDAVMSVTIDGELLILTDWSRPLMPPAVAERLPKPAPAASG